MLIGEIPAPGRKKRVCGLAGSSEALAVAELAAERPHVVFIAREVAAAAHLAEEIRYFAPERRVAVFPDWEILPYERFSPPQSLVAERMRTLASLGNRVPGVTVLAAHTLMFPVPPPEYIAAHSFAVACGDRIEPTAFVRRLSDQGYLRVDRVMDPGEFGVHGGQIDVFPPGSPLPVRIVLDDDAVEELRLFDPESQRSIDRRSSVEVLPARECPLDREASETFCINFLARGGEFSPQAQIYQAVRHREPVGGVEFFLPLFYGRSSSFMDHVPPDAAIVTHQGVGDRLEEDMADAKARCESVEAYEARPVLPPKDLFHGQERLHTRLKAHPHIEICEDGTAGARRCGTSKIPALELNPRSKEPFARLEGFLQDFDGRVLVASAGSGRRDMIRRNLASIDFVEVQSHEDFRMRPAAERFDAVAPLREGFILEREREAYVTEYEIYRVHAPPRRRALAAGAPSAPLLAVEDIREGDPVVHARHGIGIYCGLEIQNDGEHEEEFIVLEYQNQAKLLVPVGDLHMIGRYIAGSADAEVPVACLGSAKWSRTCAKAQRKVHDLAVHLIEIQARRRARSGRRLEVPAREYAAFIARFGYMETPDQQAAINDVLADLQLDRPMDRLICGEVGFGKTEVALRAAFIAAANGCQVAVLAPTTILAAQHYQVFSDRFSGFPYRVAEFSRLKSAAELRAASKEVAAGAVAVAIGTHQLLQENFRFKNLGLLVIDEEHRFGVRQKERLKALRGDIEVLTMTATPIPRTLSMALEGISDLSLIASAPEGRSRVLTFVADYRKDLVVDAIRREIMRGGQAFYLHNSVVTIEDALERLREWMPDIRFEYAHGKTPKTRLERIVRKFYRHECDVLVTTTIVELGIDIANANTMVIERAERLGLAQLHQLRGRVGRSHRQAYAYLLTESELDEESPAYARLAAIRGAAELGGGYRLALRDLEIRGAGDVLGEAQSGQIEAVGYSLYRQMLDSSIRLLNKESPAMEPEEEIRIEAEESFLLPADYCPSVNERLRLYRRLRMTSSREQIDELSGEIADRFGPPPASAELLLEVHRFRIRMAGMGVRSIRFGPSGASVNFADFVPYADFLIECARNGRIRLAESNRMILPLEGKSLRSALHETASFFEGLAAEAEPSAAEQPQLEPSSR